MTNIDDLINNFIDLKSNSETVCFITRDTKVLEKHKINVRKFKNEVLKFKKEMIESKNEDLANKCLSLEFFCDALSDVTDMLLSLKHELPNEAWNYLISAQENVQNSLRAYEIHNLNQTTYSEKLLSIEKTLFPPQNFISPSMLMKNFKCSICKENYEHCDHVENQPYMGRLCFRLATLEKGLHIANVTHPVDKRRRFLSITQGEVEIDIMTLRKVKN